MTAPAQLPAALDVLTVGEAATLLRRPPRSVRAMCERGLIPGAALLLGRWQIPRAGILRLFESEKLMGHPVHHEWVHIDPPETSGVYFLATVDRVKIGMAKNLRKRCRDIAKAASHELEVLGFIETNKAAWQERELHDRFAHLRAKAEWFEIKGELLDFLVKLNARLREGK